jgi:hypothetical protein
MRVGDEGAIVGLAVTCNAMRPGALAIAIDGTAEGREWVKNPCR